MIIKSYPLDLAIKEYIDNLSLSIRLGEGWMCNLKLFVRYDGEEMY